jgi:hypothetical protein
VHAPQSVSATRGQLRVTFSDPFDPVKAADFTFKTWSLQRTSGYGSRHHDERPVEVRDARLSPDKRTVILDIPELAPTHCYELAIKSNGIERVLHGTILTLGGHGDSR